MSSNKIIISGTGCALADYLYNGISFSSEGFKKYLSRTNGDGGLCPGKLVFTEELESFAGKTHSEIMAEIIGNRTADAFNVGGPSIVSLIHAAQLLEPKDFEIRFFGLAGKDDTADKILGIVRQTPLDIRNYELRDQKPTSFTDVLSDPDFDHGHGERTFVNTMGAAWDYSPDRIPGLFFDSDLVCFGGTALVPQIHDNLSRLLEKARKKNCITLVNTVFDFRNEKKNPGQPWPLVNHPEDYGLIDILIMDCEEALRISGQPTLETATVFFASSGVSSFIITNGAKELIAWSDGGMFEKTNIVKLPVSRMVTDELKSSIRSRGDTTGCGDNFAGGIISSLAWQLTKSKKGHFNFTEALSWGIASGGFCCFTIGGTFLEKNPGAKRKEVTRIQQEYLRQISY